MAGPRARRRGRPARLERCAHRATARVVGGRTRPTTGQGHRRLERRLPRRLWGRRPMTRDDTQSSPLASAGDAGPYRCALADEPLVPALAYAVAGWPVLPLHTPTPAGDCSCPALTCTSVGKHPRTRSGATEASTDPNRIA